jgi:hypothetical protein
MGRTIKVARFPAGQVPQTQSHKYANGQTFTIGAALALTAGELVEATSPIVGATLWGFAQEPVASKPGWGIANSPVVVTGQVQEVSAVRANGLHVYSGQLVNGSSAVVTPTQADVGVNYGLKSYAVNGKNEWYVDKSQTAGNACVTVVDYDADTNTVYFTVMAARMLAQ